MWSVWPETVRLHLGQGFALLQIGNGEASLTQFPATLPLGRQLQRLENPLGSKGRRRRLCITLSGALCPAVDFTVPANVVRWQERRELGRNAAAARLGSAIGDIACEIDDYRPGVTGAVTTALMQELERWSGEHRLRLVSVMPLWAVATACRVVSRAAIRAAVVHEPDALTMIANGVGYARSVANAVSLPSNGDVAAGKVLVEAWLRETGIAESEVASLGFGDRKKARIDGGPAVWPFHWTMV